MAATTIVDGATAVPWGTAWAITIARGVRLPSRVAVMTNRTASRKLAKIGRMAITDMPGVTTGSIVASAHRTWTGAATTATTTPVVTPNGIVAAVPTPVGASSIVVMQAPPAAQQEVPSARPTRDHVWVSGYWSWRNSRYEWSPGHWEVPPRSGAVWVPPRWQPEGTSFRFYEGYWD